MRRRFGGTGTRAPSSSDGRSRTSGLRKTQPSRSPARRRRRKCAHSVPARTGIGARTARRSRSMIVSRDFVFAGRHAPLVLAIDVTEQRHLEEQLRQAQKMEAVGRLAGGIAHDFNNLLTIINGYVRAGAPAAADASDPLRDDIEEIAQAAARAALLTRQLLAFSRKQVVDACGARPERRGRRRWSGCCGGSSARTSTFITLLAPAVARVTADRGQLEQVLMNLVVNARDAMPGGGVLTVATADVVLSAADAVARADAAGRVRDARVRDTGSGMDDATRARIFEPFFTTKPVGRGHGTRARDGVRRSCSRRRIRRRGERARRWHDVHRLSAAHGAGRSRRGVRRRRAAMAGHGDDSARGGRGWGARRRASRARRGGLHGARGANAAEAVEGRSLTGDCDARLDVVMPGLNATSLVGCFDFATRVYGRCSCRDTASTRAAKPGAVGF